MNRAIWFLALVVVVGVLSDAFAPYRAARFDVTLRDAEGTVHPLGPAGAARLSANRADVLQIRAANSGLHLGGRLELTLEGGLVFVGGSGRDNPVALGPGRAGCTSRGALTRCHFGFQLRDGDSLILGAATGEPRIAAIRLEVIKTVPSHVADLGSLALLFCAVALFGAVCLVLRIGVSMRAWLLAVLGGAWLLATGGWSGAAMLTLIIALGIGLRALLTPAPDGRRVSLLAAAIIGVFVLSKIVANASVGMFANPGGMPLPVPLGLAFFTIRALDLTFRAATRELRSLTARDYLSYLLFPPTIAAGPIFTFSDFRDSASERVTLVDWSAGIARIGIGVVKKVACEAILARLVGPRLIGLYGDPLGHGDLWPLLILNALYVYADFSAYSDIAIGSGRLVGWRVPENFRWPFLRSNLRSFWQSWHITLSAWVSRWVHFYLAFHLRRAPEAMRAALPVLGSLLIIGLWHELQITWLLWGLHHGIGILLSDLLVAWLVTPGASSDLLALPRRVAGIAAVIIWVSLSHCFTLVSEPQVALGLWWRAITGG